MSTRGAIVRIDGERGFKGRYHHWDSYPSGLGATLFNLYRDHFKRDLPLMLHTLIDEHKAGWSTINGADFNLEPGFSERRAVERGAYRPQCFCHGDRHEEAWLVNEKNAAKSGVEYVYMFTEDRKMHVLSSYCPDGKKMIGMFGMGDSKAAWRIVRTIDLDGDEPDWDALDEEAA